MAGWRDGGMAVWRDGGNINDLKSAMRVLRQVFPAHRLLLAAYVAATVACAPAPATLVPAPATCATGQSTLVRDALYFGLMGPDHAVIPDASWQAFLATKVTPAFPDGFTVVSATGQWREASGTIIQEPSRMVVIMHQPSASVDATIRGLIDAYKTEFRQEAVLWERGAVCVAF